MQIKKTVVSALAGAAIIGTAVGSALAPQQVKAAEGDKGTITGLLVTKGDNWVEVRGDDAKDAKRFTPRWIGGAPQDGGGLDKTVLEAFKKIPAPNRVKLDWVTEEGVRVTNIEIIAPTEKSGVVEGTISALGDRWVEVKAGDKPAERYSPHWTEDGPAKDTLRALGELRVGNKVRLEWSYDERLRIVSVKKAD